MFVYEYLYWDSNENKCVVFNINYDICIILVFFFVEGLWIIYLNRKYLNFLFIEIIFSLNCISIGGEIIVIIENFIIRLKFWKGFLGNSSFEFYEVFFFF